MVLGMAVMTVLMGGIASAMILASRAVPDRQTPIRLMIDGYHVVDGLASELYAAQTITARAMKSVTFTVADRSGDSAPETIQYAWNGIEGQPLTRRYNGGTASAVLDDVRQFAMTFRTQTISGATRVTMVEISLSSGTANEARVDTSVQLPNQPL